MHDDVMCSQTLASLSVGMSSTVPCMNVTLLKCRRKNACSSPDGLLLKEQPPCITHLLYNVCAHPGSPTC